MNKSTKGIEVYISCTKGKEQKKSYVKNNAEVNWNTECSQRLKSTLLRGLQR